MSSMNSFTRTSLSRYTNIIALVVLICLHGCSTIKLGYNNAPSLSYWWIDDYVDFDETQSKKVREELERLHQWHRTAELPKIAALLQSTQALIVNEMSPAQACVVLAETRTRMAAVSAQAEEGIAQIAATITPTQRQHIARKLEKNNAQWKEDWSTGTPEERQEKRLKAAVERGEQLYDSLSEKQIELLRELDNASAYDADLSYKERLRRQQDLLQTLARINPPNAADKPTTSQAVNLIHDYFTRNSSSPDPVYRAFAEKMYAESCNAFAIVHNSTTPKQRERAIKRIAAYARDARDLIGLKELK